MSLFDELEIRRCAPNFPSHFFREVPDKVPGSGQSHPAVHSASHDQVAQSCVASF